jgi:hypothetical protein
MSCCGDEIPIQYQYTSDGVLQMSTDGGATWVDAPERDPRNNSTRFPPMSGADGNDKKCIAATGAAALVKEQVGDQLTDDMGRYTLSQLITDWVGTMIESSNPFQALVTVIANQIFALVIATLRPALTDAVYDTFKCILYCDMLADASFNDAQWAQVRSDITDQIGGIAGVFLEHLVYLLGVVGLTNLCRAGGAATGDCSTCDCPSAIRIYVSPGGGTEVSWDGTTLTANSIAGGPHGYILYIQFQPDYATLPPNMQCAKLIPNIVYGGVYTDNTNVAVLCGATAQTNLGYGFFQTTEIQQGIFVSPTPFQMSFTAIN